MSVDQRRYSPTFLEHMMSPRHMVGAAGPDFDPDGEAMVTGALPGASLRLWIAVSEAGRICRIAWRVAGMPQAVPSTSIMAEWVVAPRSPYGGMTLEEALGVTPEQVAERLGGLPSQKIHESVLGPRALREAVGDRFRRLGLDGVARDDADDEERVCHCLGVTARELKGAVHLGQSFEEAQEALGVSTGCGTCEPDARALHAWFRAQRSLSPVGGGAAPEEV